MCRYIRTLGWKTPDPLMWSRDGPPKVRLWEITPHKRASFRRSTLPQSRRLGRPRPHSCREQPYHHRPFPGSASGTRGVSECQAPSLSEPYCLEPQEFPLRAVLRFTQTAEEIRVRLFSCVFLAAASMWAQANGQLQIHFIDVGQGDGAILISPLGQTVAFDIGRDMVGGSCDKPVAYYRQLGIRKLDYLIVSHYHEDHIGCVPSILASVSVDHVEDRGQSYDSTFYDAYARTTRGLRSAARVGDKIVLDETSPAPPSPSCRSCCARSIC